MKAFNIGNKMHRCAQRTCTKHTDKPCSDVLFECLLSCPLFWQPMLNHTMHALDFRNVVDKTKVTLFHTYNQLQHCVTTNYSEVVYPIVDQLNMVINVKM